MGGRRLAGGPEDGSEGAVSGYPESLPERALDIHGKNLTMECRREQQCHHVNLAINEAKTRVKGVTLD